MFRDPESLRESSLLPSSIRTRRLHLAPLGPEHAVTLALLANNPQIARNLARLPHPYSMADAEEFLAKSEPRGGARRAVMLIGERGGKDFIGVVGIEPQDSSRTVELGYWLGEPYWGRGLATEAAQAMVDLAFSHFGHASISARCRVTNGASRRVIEKCGFQYVGQDLASTPNAGMVAVDRFVLDRSTWDGLRGWTHPEFGAEVEVPS